MKIPRIFRFTFTPAAVEAFGVALRRSLVIAGGVLVLGSASMSRAADCMTLLPLFQRGGSVGDVAQLTGLSFAEVDSCRRELSRPIVVGPEGPPPAGAAGPPPVGAPGPPPMGAAGRAPFGAVGPPPLGRTLKRLP